MASRANTTVVPFSDERGEDYKYGKECFIEEAKTLAQFIGNDGIVRIYNYFEENGTAYFVMDYIEGTTFDEYIKQNGGKLSFDEAYKTLSPVLDALGIVHSRGIIHRDVTPDNIFITNDGKVKLLDFGAARYSLGDRSQSLDVVLKHGFAPKEQYVRRGKQGPYTDVYSLGATFYFALTGKRPPDAVDRMDQDALIPPSRLGVNVPEVAEKAILMALSVQPADRFQNMQAFKGALEESREVSDQGKVYQRFFSAQPESDTSMAQKGVDSATHSSQAPIFNKSNSQLGAIHKEGSVLSKMLSYVDGHMKETKAFGCFLFIVVFLIYLFKLNHNRYTYMEYLIPSLAFSIGVYYKRKIAFATGSASIAVNHLLILLEPLYIQEQKNAKEAIYSILEIVFFLVMILFILNRPLIKKEITPGVILGLAVISQGYIILYHLFTSSSVDLVCRITYFCALFIAATLVIKEKEEK